MPTTRIRKKRSKTTRTVICGKGFFKSLEGASDSPFLGEIRPTVIDSDQVQVELWYATLILGPSAQITKSEINAILITLGRRGSFTASVEDSSSGQPMVATVTLLAIYKKCPGAKFRIDLVKS